MKTLLALALLVSLQTITYSQDREYPFAASVSTDMKSMVNDKINLGISIEYQMNITYFKASIRAYPNLNGYSYIEFAGVPIGFNYHHRFDEFRLYSGTKLGFIRRDNIVFPMVGMETGVDIRLNTTTFIGLVFSIDGREDGKMWDPNAEHYFQGSTYIRLGFRF